MSSARSGIKDLNSVQDELKKGKYEQQDHESAAKALGHLKTQLSLIKMTSDPLRQAGEKGISGLYETVSDALELEEQLWKGLAPQYADGAKIVPLLQPAFESVTNAFESLYPKPASGPAQTDAFGRDRTQAVNNAAGAVGRVDASGAKDEKSLFWENQQARQGDVDGPMVSAYQDFNSMMGSGHTPAQSVVFTNRREKAPVVLAVPGFDTTFTGGLTAGAAGNRADYSSLLRDSARSSYYAASLSGLPVKPVKAVVIPKKEEKLQPAVKPPPKVKTAAELAAELSEANCRQVLRDHSKIAEMCKDSPNLAPLLAGFMEALKEQFGTIEGLATNLAFMLLGLVLSALSGFGLIAKVAVSLVSFGFLIYTLGPLIKQGISATADWWKAKDGSTMKFDALLRMGKIGGSVMIMALMAAIGWGVGKTKPGKAAMSSVSSAVSSKLVSTGIAGKVGKLDAVVPPKMLATLKRWFGPAQNPVNDGPEQTAKTAKAVDEKAAPPGKTEVKPKLTPAENMARNQRHIQEATDDLFRQIQKKEGNLANVPYDQLVKAFDKIDDFPPEIPGRPASVLKREESVAAFAKEYLGIKEPVKVVAPDVKPASGAEIYKIQVGGKDVGVFKIFNKQGAPELMRELGSGSVYKGAGIEGMNTVKPMGAFRIGDTGRIGYFMETAPGNNLYAAMKSVRGHKGQSLSLPEVQGQVEAVAKVIADIHKKAGKSTVVSRSQKQQIVNKMMDNLESLLRPDEGKGRGWTISEKDYRKIKARVEAQGKAFVEAEGTVGVVNHGDGHPGNFYYDPKTKKVTVIDIETTMESFNMRGEGTMSRGNDVSRFMESIRLNNKSKGLNLLPDEIVALQKSFYEAYAKASGAKPGTLRTEIDFYNNKLHIAALKSAKNHADFATFLEVIIGEGPENLALPKSLGAAAAPIKLTSRIKESSYAVRQAESMGQQAQRDVDSLLRQLTAGNEQPGKGSHPLGNGFFELRGENGGRVIVKQTAPSSFDIVGKFQGHQRGKTANSALIQRIIDDYNAMNPEK